MSHFKNNLKRCRKNLKSLKKYFIYKTVSSNDEIESQDLLLLHHLLPQRIHQLGTSAYLELKKGKLLSGSTLARAAGETLIILVLLNTKANEVLKSSKKQELLDLANQLLFSTRILYENSFLEFYKKFAQNEVPDDSLFNKATNILTQLEKVEKKIPEFKLLYQFISEYSHPCTFGILTSGKGINNDDINSFNEKTTRLAKSISSIFLRITLANTFTIMFENEGLFKKLFKDDKEYYEGKISDVMDKYDKYTSKIFNIEKHKSFYKLYELYTK